MADVVMADAEVKVKKEKPDGDEVMTDATAIGALKGTIKKEDADVKIKEEKKEEDIKDVSIKGEGVKSEGMKSEGVKGERSADDLKREMKNEGLKREMPDDMYALAMKGEGVKGEGVKGEGIKGEGVKGERIKGERSRSKKKKKKDKIKKEKRSGSPNRKDKKDKKRKRSQSDGGTRKRKSKWGPDTGGFSMTAIPAGRSGLMPIDSGEDFLPKFSDEEMVLRTLVLENLSLSCTGQELIEFFNGAILAVTANAVQQAANRNMAPVFACTVTEEDRGGSKRKTAELKFRTPDGSSVGMKLSGIEYKGHKVHIKRPENFPKPDDGQDPSVKINLHEMSMAKELASLGRAGLPLRRRRSGDRGPHLLAAPPEAEGGADAFALVNPSSPEVLAQQEQVRRLRLKLGSSRADGGLHEALSALHRLPQYQRLGNLSVSQHRYGTDRLVGDVDEVTKSQRGMLLHGQPVQFLDVPSMLLPCPVTRKGWASYNPSLVPITWLGEEAFLLTYRQSTWNLCTWAARGSPVEQLPEKDGRRTVTSKVAAAILRKNFEVLVAPKDIGGLENSKHSCIHHSGMRRVGLDDGRVFLLRAEPWMLYAAVALPGQSEYCFHHMMLCPLALPDSVSGKVSCKRTTVLSFPRADEISEEHRAAGRLANVHQKNWVPFVHNGVLYLVFTLEPFTVLQVDSDTGLCRQVSETPTPALSVFHAVAAGTSGHSTLGVHGGSPLLQLPASHGGEFLGIGRVARGNLQYTLFFYTVAAKERASRSTASGVGFRFSSVSSLFCFASASASYPGLCETIQFAGGLALDDHANLLVTYGVNDCEAKVAFIQLSRVMSMLRSGS
ncbi:unnamed protein product [Polarella glacialis]|uniref:Uncharacterized protein n=1 Tax=Polarella glacialis TaxID=89957 RepID=A0A813E3K4_POLGL|nr:unnamed protein product [Polarella glacialis]